MQKKIEVENEWRVHSFVVWLISRDFRPELDRMLFFGFLLHYIVVEYIVQIQKQNLLEDLLQMKAVGRRRFHAGKGCGHGNTEFVEVTLVL